MFIIAEAPSKHVCHTESVETEKGCQAVVLSSVLLMQVLQAYTAKAFSDEVRWRM